MFKKRNEKQALPEKLPTHVAIIMDGNGRWAKRRGMPRSAGHRKGAKTFRAIADYANEIGIQYLTFYTFSSENWKRDVEEITAIMDLFREYLKEALERQDETNMQMRFLGDRNYMPQDIVAMMNEIEVESSKNTGAIVNLAINYGGRAEIVNAVKEIALKAASDPGQIEKIDEAMVNDHLYTRTQPDPDLIIRPSGEYRLSNFLIWQSAYAEFWFDEILWPDFTTKDLDRALIDYAKRNRRFGG